MRSGGSLTRLGRFRGEGARLRPRLAPAGYFSRLFRLRPPREADALVAVANPSVMRVVVLFAFHFQHRVSTGHRLARGTIHGPKVGLVGLRHHVRRERLAIGPDDKTTVGRFFDGYGHVGGVGGGVGDGKRQKQGS